MPNAVGRLFVLIAALLASDARGADMWLGKDDVGQLWLQIVGRIEDGDDLKFKALLVDAVSRREQIARVSVYSSGGQPGTAMKIGRYIRDMYLATVAPQIMPLLGRQTCDIHAAGGRATVFEYDPLRRHGDPRCVCSGECFLVWAAGAIRHGDAVQVQRATADKHGLPSDARTASADRELAEAYLREMDITEDVIGRMSVPAPDNIGYLTSAERAVLANGAAISFLQDVYATRCAHRAANSPAAFACQKAALRDLYWAGARRLLPEND
jgi:hypothetical protein